MLGKISADDVLKYFFYFLAKIGFDVWCIFFPQETVFMKFQMSKPIFEEKYYQFVGRWICP